MTRSGPFPNPDSDYNTYIKRAIPYLDTHKARLKVSAASINTLKDLLKDWKDVYPKSRSGATRTTSITARKTELRKKITNRLRAVYRDIPQSVLTVKDRATLGLKKRAKKHSKRPAISSSPGVALQTMGSSWMRVTCRREKDSDRASRHPDADAIELCYKIGGEQPESPAGCDTTIIFTRSIYLLKLDPVDAGQRLWCYARWKNIRHHQKSGPWCELRRAIIG